MDELHRLHPLIAAAAGQVASLDVQIDYFEDHLLRPYAPPVVEALEHRLELLREERRRFRGIHDRLEEKLVVSEVDDRDASSLGSSHAVPGAS